MRPQRRSLETAVKKNLLIYTGFVTDTWSSIEQRYIWLEKGLASDFNVYWLVPPAGSVYSRCNDEENRSREPVYVTELKRLNASVIEMDITRANGMLNFIRLSRLFRRYRIHAVYTHFNPLRYYLELTAAMNRIKVIKGEHNDEFAPDRKYRLCKYLFWRLVTDYYIFVSSQVEKHYGRIGLGSPSCTVHNGFDISHLPPPDPEKSRQRLIRHYNLPASARIISCIAKIESRKNQLFLVNMMKLINRPDLFLFLVGSTKDRDYMATIRKAVQTAGLEKNIIMTGYSPDVYTFIDASEMTLLPSFSEGLPNVIIESFFMQTPVITSDFYSIKEIVVDGENGFCLDTFRWQAWADAVLTLLNDQTLQGRMGKAGRKTVANKFAKSVFLLRTRNSLIRFLK